MNTAAINLAVCMTACENQAQAAANTSLQNNTPVDHFKTLPQELQLNVAEYLVDSTKYVASRKLFAVNRDFRKLEKEFVNSRNDSEKCIIISALLRVKNAELQLSNIPKTLYEHLNFKETIPKLTGELNLKDQHINNDGKNFCDLYPFPFRLFREIGYCLGIIKKTSWQLLSEFKSIKSLNFLNCDLENDDLETLSQSSQLETLMLGSSMPMANLVSSLPIVNFSINEILNSERCKVHDQGIGYIAQLPNLRHLYLDACKTTPQALQSIWKLQNLETLFSAIPYYEGIDVREEASLEQLTTLKRLKHLHLLYSHLSHNQLSSVGKLSKLKTLGISCLDTGRLSQLSRLKKLENLAVSHESVTDADLLSLKNHRKLKKLYLVSAAVHETITASSFSFFQSLQELDSLVIGHDSTTSLQNILSLKKLKNLGVLHKLKPDDLLLIGTLTQLESLALLATASSLRMAILFKQLRNLSSLSLIGEVSDENLGYISHLKKLEYFDIEIKETTNIFSHLLPALQKLKHLKSVTFVIPDKDLSEDEKKKIVKSLPCEEIHFCKSAMELSSQSGMAKRFDFCFNLPSFFKSLTQQDEKDA
jgi:hypothetical protein